ncbi:hypothetical protein [Leifsonia poae]|uniref:hypothetical protein n=1 Tax=Leifsonia poae TaxID=110933 RepID=UPI001CBC11C8|nr:hypothetical protein [Leifsonia poae]
MTMTTTLGIGFDSVPPIAEAHTAAELDALPAGSRILAPYPDQPGRGDILVRHNDGLWHRDVFAPISSDALTAFPVRILDVDASARAH